jgi:hypothetical protein
MQTPSPVHGLSFIFALSRPMIFSIDFTARKDPNTGHDRSSLRAFKQKSFDAAHLVAQQNHASSRSRRISNGLMVKRCRLLWA